MRVTRSPWSSSVAPKGRDHAGRTCLSAAHETGRPTAAGFRKPFHIRAFGPNAASGNPPALLPRQDDLKVLCSRDQVALSRRGRSGTASVEAVAYGKVGPVRLESTGHCATATTGFGRRHPPGETRELSPRRATPGVNRDLWTESVEVRIRGSGARY